MRVVLTTSIPGGNIVSIGLGGGGLVVVDTTLRWHAEPLMGDYLYLLDGFERVNVPLMAALHPVAWKRILSLVPYTCTRPFSPHMQFPPVEELLPLAVASAGEALGDIHSVAAVWADPLDRKTMYRVIMAGLESGVKELWLVYVYTSPALYGDLEIGDTAAAYYFLKRNFPRMVDRVSFKLEEKSLRFNEHMKNYKRIYRRRRIDLLGLAFGDGAQLARDLLSDVLENGGAITLKSLLDFVREEEGLNDIFDRLLDYGYLRLAGIPPQVTITEKGLYALRK